jgi:hypothetical protein
LKTRRVLDARTTQDRAVVLEVEAAGRRVLRRPLVHHRSVHVDQVDVIGIERRDQSVAVEGTLLAQEQAPRAFLGNGILGNRVANLARLGGIVLLVALYGTIPALMNELQTISLLKAPVPGDFAIAASEALASVAFGLVVALFCFVAFFWLDARLTQRTLAVREIAEELVHDAAEKGALSDRA